MAAFLPGMKTYLVSVGIVLGAGLKALGYIDDATYQTMNAVLIGGGFAALRNGVKQAGQ